MNRQYFLKTERIGFSEWTENDIDLAHLLWGDPAVVKYICAGGKFTDQEIQDRLAKEIENKKRYHIQYWPIFRLETGDFIGCCGLRPYDAAELSAFEFGIHIRPDFWRQGIATEAAGAVLLYAFDHLAADKLFAGHHPDNIGSKNLLAKLGFRYIGDHFYAPTQLYHPSYVISKS
jgi:Acetyltransferases, including N-acetylases of ribosomal proteins